MSYFNFIPFLSNFKHDYLLHKSNFSTTKKGMKSSSDVPQLKDQSNSSLLQEKNASRYHQSGADISAHTSDGTISALIIRSTAHGWSIPLSFF